MKPRTFLIPSRPQSELVTLDLKEAHHLRDVLRLRPGSRINLIDPTGCRYSAILQTVTRGLVTARILVPEPAKGELPLSVTAATAIPKGHRLDWMIEKLCELGASSWIPLLSRYSVVQGLAPSKRLRLGRIVSQVMKQCGRSSLMQICEPMDLQELNRRFSMYDLVYLATPLASTPLPREIKDPTGSLIFIIGPEGGFTVQEEQGMIGSGARPVRLSRSILRIETAAISFMSIISTGLS